MNDLDRLNLMKAKHPLVMWCDKKQKVVSEELHVQVKLDVSGRVQCRFLGHRLPQWVPVHEFEDLLVQREAEHEYQLNKREPNEPLVEGLSLLRQLGAIVRRTKNKYWDAEFMPSKFGPATRAWLRFTDHEPRRRRWSVKHREMMHAAGVYAYAVRLEGGQACFYYVGPGVRNQWWSQWFEPMLLQAKLQSANLHADEFKWREREYHETSQESVRKAKEPKGLTLAKFEAGLAKTRAELAKYDAEQSRLRAEQAEWVAQKKAEYAAEEVGRSGLLCEKIHIVGGDGLI